MRKTTLLFAALLLIATGVGAGWWLGRDRLQGEAAARIASAVEGEAIPAATVESSGRHASAPAALTPLPSDEPLSDDAPALELLARLDGRARQGDAAAACRLGSALLHCIRISAVMGSGMRFDPEAIARAPAKDQTVLVDAVARAQERLTRMEAACSGISREAHQLLALRYLLSAAQGGNTAARAQFVKASPTVTDVLQFPEIGVLYSANAPRLFEAMWQEGDPEAIVVLHRFGSAPSPETRQAPWLAIPPELRNGQLASELWRLRVLATSPMPETFRPSQRLPHEPDPDPAILATAQRYWDERFENAPGIEAMRAERDRSLAQRGQEQGRMREASLFPKDCHLAD